MTKEPSRGAAETNSANSRRLTSEGIFLNINRAQESLKLKQHESDALKSNNKSNLSFRSSSFSPSALWLKDF